MSQDLWWSLQYIDALKSKARKQLATSAVREAQAIVCKAPAKAA
jgi:hypothetical protein